jgi:PAS domain S-box-containing protein
MSIRRHLASHDMIPAAAHAALDAGTVGAIVCDTSRIYDANDHFLETVGFTRAELEAGELSWVRMTVPESMVSDARAIAQLRVTGRADVYDKEFFHRDGTRMLVRLADVRLELEPLSIFAFVARADAPGEVAIVDEIDAATRSGP